MTDIGILVDRFFFSVSTLYILVHGLLASKVSNDKAAAKLIEDNLYIRGPQPPGHGLVLVHGLLGTGLHSRR